MNDSDALNYASVGDRQEVGSHAYDLAIPSCEEGT